MLVHFHKCTNKTGFKNFSKQNKFCVYTIANDVNPYTQFEFKGKNIPILLGGMNTVDISKNNEEYDFLFADFKCGKINYKITAKNIPALKFYKTVEGIIKLNLS